MRYGIRNFKTECIIRSVDLRGLLDAGRRPALLDELPSPAMFPRVIG
jgi:hypothetical protein